MLPTCLTGKSRDKIGLVRSECDKQKILSIFQSLIQFLLNAFPSQTLSGPYSMALQNKFHLGNVHLVCQVRPALMATLSIIFSYLFMDAIQQACKQAGQPIRGAQSP